MGVAEIEYTWVYPANWHFSGEPWRIRWLQIPYLQAKPRRELHFFLCLRTVRAASFQRWGTHAATETGIKSQNASLECSIWNSKRCYMGVQTPKMSISHIHTYIYTYFIAIIDRSPCPFWTSPQNKMCNMLPKQRMLETCIKCFKLQTAPQHTLFSSHAAPILMEQMPWQNQAEFGKYDEQST